MMGTRKNWDFFLNILKVTIKDGAGIMRKNGSIARIFYGVHVLCLSVVDNI